MDISPDGGKTPLPSLSHQLSPAEVNMDLTMCGLLVERAEELARLYAEQGNWNEVKERWFDERLSNRSTRGSSQKIFRVLTSRFKNAPTTLPKPSLLPEVFEHCETARDKAQILYFYLVSDDTLVRYAVHEYSNRLAGEKSEPLDFSNETLQDVLNGLTYTDGSSFEYAESTTERWCEGLRSVMREIGVLEGQRTVTGYTPAVGTVPLLVAMDYSYETGDEDWITAPRGLLYLFQPEKRWEELFDRVASTDAWEYLELHGNLNLRPTEEPYAWIHPGSDS
ncbi:BrxA family protein [Haloarcula amylovorans]|uniref:BrxA family protein n=1 Tax=Haloarcula amylovorans TaxID=2562280 RepID=UPI001075E1BE|nr:BrxA family protein [Halomicroarcula amylolytica]